jgi:hypothetical protein
MGIKFNLITLPDCIHLALTLPLHSDQMSELIAGQKSVNMREPPHKLGTLRNILIVANFVAVGMLILTAM